MKEDKEKRRRNDDGVEAQKAGQKKEKKACG